VNISTNWRRPAIPLLLLVAALAAWATSQLPSSTTATTPRLVVSSLRLGFGSQGTDVRVTREIFVSNRGGGSLLVRSLILQGTQASQFSFRSECSGEVVAAARCRVLVDFLPIAAIAHNAALRVETSSGVETVALSGVGVAPKVTWSPSAIKFPRQYVGTVTEPRTVTVRNTGKGVLRVDSIRLVGAAAAEFQLRSDCPARVEAGQRCSLEVRFSPTQGGDKQATLELASSIGTDSLDVRGVALTAKPELEVSASNLSFAEQGTETVSKPRSIVVRNKGTAPLQVSSVTVTGSDAFDFLQSNSCGKAIDPRERCEIGVQFAPLTAGEKLAALSVVSNASSAPVSIVLRGVAAGPALTASRSALSFSAGALGLSSEAQRVTLRNSGKGLLRIRYITRVGADRLSFVQSNDCGVPLAAGASCTVSVSYYPGTPGRKTAELVVSTSASDRTAVIALDGTLAATASTRPVSRRDGFRFLNQATFGATERDYAALAALGDTSVAYNRWIDLQTSKPISLQLPALVASVPPSPNEMFDIPGRHQVRVEEWFTHALWGEDQLRQRVAWALSQIFVVSDASILFEFPFATAHFYDTLSRHAFGNYRDLLQAVTLHPAMGNYLSMLGNRRATPGTNLRPDENYAREMMQLFSIGLVQLEVDGTIKRDADGQPLPTYTPDVVAGFARVFTGWHWDCPAYYWINATRLNRIEQCNFFSTGPERLPLERFNQAMPMRLFPEEHENGSKQVLSYPGVRLAGGVIPARQGGEKDLQDALDNVFHHPNVGPFIGKQLIQKLVTSNPSPEYVRSVAEVFSDDGRGVRGNLEAVVRAVLLHPEARSVPTGPTAGKLKEPILRLTQFWRAFDGRTLSGEFSYRTFCCYQGGSAPMSVLGQSPNQSPSVFNFYSPFYAPPGEIAQAGLVAPEMQLANENLHTVFSSFMFRNALFFGNRYLEANNSQRDPGTMFYRIDAEWEVAYEDDKLIDMVASKLLGDPKSMSAPLRTAIRERIEPLKRHWTPGDPAFEGKAIDVHIRRSRIGDVVYLIVTSPEFAWQR